ncbi:MAG: hypothetical protein JWO12_1040 [Frankiales bacterium]|nr:hypothetical protein [Frankiales bacterium]
MPTANQMGACFDAERAMQENGHNTAARDISRSATD